MGQNMLRLQLLRDMPLVHLLHMCICSLNHDGQQ
jgi:hypothetical protein